MKNILWITLLLLAAGCLDDKSNYDYTEINDLQGKGDARFENMESRYSCYPGETVTITPEVKFTIDSLHPDISYEWYINSELKSKEQSLTFQSEKSGIYQVTFAAIDNKTGMKFFRGTVITVLARWAKSWLILSETPSGESQLSAVLMKIVKVTATDDKGEPYQKDTIVYVGEDMNISPDLGKGPKSLVEHFSVNEYTVADQLMDEIFVLQKDKAVSLHGEELTKEVYAEDEFLGDVPPGFEPVEAVLSYSCKALLDKSGLLYLTPNAVPTQFHTGLYPSEPMYGGEKFSRIIPTNKVGTYSNTFFLAISRDSNCFVGIMDDAKPSSGDNEVTLSPFNSVGARAPFVDNSSVDMSLFKNMTKEVVYIMWEDSGYDDYPEYVSILEENGVYYTHNFRLKSAKDSEGNPTVTIRKSFLQQINAAMFTHFVEAVVFPHKDYLVVANGNDLYRCTFKEDAEPVDPGTKFMSFESPVVAINYKDINSMDFGGGHLGVALENGEFYIFELIVDGETGAVTTRQLYRHAGFGKVRDVIYKFGSLNNLGFWNIN